MTQENKVRRNINAVGVLFYSRETDRILFLLRNSKDQVWSLPGGKIERGETLITALERECREEIGTWPDTRLYPLDCYRSSDDKFVYHTFFTQVEEEFIPSLNDEHIAYAWCARGVYPKPLHTGLYNTLNYSTILEKIDIICANK